MAHHAALCAYGHKDFYLALGYKAQVVKEYFLNYRALNADFTVDLQTGAVTPHQLDEVDWRVTLVDTGLQTMTGGRVKRMQPFIGNETFLLTYGDGVANVDLEALFAFHRKHGKLVTVTAVRPTARFGELELSGNQVVKFQEKPQVHEGWINGGFFVMEPGFFELIDNDQTILERSPLERAAEMGELVAYQHEGFWQCMDTKRDRDNLETLALLDHPPWQKMTQLLVIGGTGFIGHHLLRLAVEKKWIVTSLSLTLPKTERHVSGVNYLCGDILNLKQIEKILRNKDFDYVVNLGGYVNHTLFQEGGRQQVEEHFTAIQNLFTVLSREKLQRFIQIGSSDEYGNAPAPQHEHLREAPISPYSLGKVATTHFHADASSNRSLPRGDP